ncbi:hypothetical protein [Campylobacter sp. MIT 97-5078]|uniref:hypothetical protein n=1 Tax=Campylobacter sp. MIT 97-5078 TaxID=1548153 RepID=UPI0005133DEB|nr:hypothetical protein [Campylobacter sp. MIT 97-5078]KGI56802.1 hypothetical protein LR59_04775 [Campylobacter sp. MIT 97-5078]
MKTIQFKDLDHNISIKAYIQKCLQKLIFVSLAFIIIIAIVLFHRDSQTNLIAGISIFSLFSLFISFVINDLSKKLQSSLSKKKSLEVEK